MDIDLWLICYQSQYNYSMPQVAGSTQNQLRQWHLNQLYRLRSKSATSVALKISYIGDIQISYRLHSKSAALVALKISYVYIGGTQISYICIIQVQLHWWVSLLIKLYYQCICISTKQPNQ